MDTDNQADVPDQWIGFDLARESERMLCAAMTAYPHRGGRGDHREQIVRDFLVRRLPSSIEVGKGHIQDCHSQITSEFDLVLYDPLSKMILAETDAQRHVYPVEAVKAIVEVRTHIDAKAIADTSAKIQELSKLRRHFKANALANHLFDPKELAKEEKEGYSATEWGPVQPSCPPISVYLVGFDSIVAASVDKLANESKPRPRAIVCIGKYVSLCTEEGFDCLDIGHPSLVNWMVSLIGDISENRSASMFFAPSFFRYVDVPLNCDDDESSAPAT